MLKPKYALFVIAVIGLIVSPVSWGQCAGCGAEKNMQDRETIREQSTVNPDKVDRHMENAREAGQRGTPGEGLQSLKEYHRALEEESKSED